MSPVASQAQGKYPEGLETLERDGFSPEWCGGRVHAAEEEKTMGSDEFWDYLTSDSDLGEIVQFYIKKINSEIFEGIKEAKDRYKILHENVISKLFEELGSNRQPIPVQRLKSTCCINGCIKSECARDYRLTIERAYCILINYEKSDKRDADEYEEDNIKSRNIRYVNIYLNEWVFCHKFSELSQNRLIRCFVGLLSLFYWIKVSNVISWSDLNNDLIGPLIALKSNFGSNYSNTKRWDSGVIVDLQNASKKLDDSSVDITTLKRFLKVSVEIRSGSCEFSRIACAAIYSKGVCMYGDEKEDLHTKNAGVLNAQLDRFKRAHDGSEIDRSIDAAIKSIQKIQPNILGDKFAKKTNIDRKLWGWGKDYFSYIEKCVLQVASNMNISDPEEKEKLRRSVISVYCGAYNKSKRSDGHPDVLLKTEIKSLLMAAYDNDDVIIKPTLDYVKRSCYVKGDHKLKISCKDLGILE